MPFIPPPPKNVSRWPIQGTFRKFAAGTFTVLADDAVILCDCTLGAINLNLPKSENQQTHRVTIFKTDATASTVTVIAFPGDVMEGGPATTSTITSAGQALEFVADGLLSWWVISEAGAPAPPPPPIPSGVGISFPSYEGPSGEDGVPGPPGLRGVAGAAGATGPAGLSATFSGLDGDDGEMGPPGIRGQIGATGT